MPARVESSLATNSAAEEANTSRIQPKSLDRARVDRAGPFSMLCRSAHAPLLHDRIENPKQIQIDFSKLDVFARRLSAFFRLPRFGFQGSYRVGAAPVFLRPPQEPVKYPQDH
jgi:hypothetical protein